MKNLRTKKLIIPLFGLLLLLSGCSRVNNNAPGFYKYLAVPGTYILNEIVKFTGSYGIALITLTVIIRLCLVPIVLHQAKKSTVQQAKMHAIQPEINVIKQKQSQVSSQQEKQHYTHEIFQLYRKRGVSMTGGIGCLPFIIQIPIFAGLFSSIKYSSELFHSIFLGISLGRPNLWLALLAFLSYMFQIYISIQGMDDKNSKAIWFMCISPAMVLLISLAAPAGLAIYFFVGGLFSCFQTHVSNIYQSRIKPQLQKKVERKMLKDQGKNNNDGNGQNISRP